MVPTVPPSVWKADNPAYAAMNDLATARANWPARTIGRQQTITEAVSGLPDSFEKRLKRRADRYLELLNRPPNRREILKRGRALERLNENHRPGTKGKSCPDRTPGSLFHDYRGIAGPGNTRRNRVCRAGVYHAVK